MTAKSPPAASARLKKESHNPMYSSYLTKVKVESIHCECGAVFYSLEDWSNHIRETALEEEAKAAPTAMSQLRSELEERHQKRREQILKEHPLPTTWLSNDGELNAYVLVLTRLAEIDAENDLPRGRVPDRVECIKVPVRKKIVWGPVLWLLYLDMVVRTS